MTRHTKPKKKDPKAKDSAAPQENCVDIDATQCENLDDPGYSNNVFQPPLVSLDEETDQEEEFFHTIRSRLDSDGEEVLENSFGNVSMENNMSPSSESCSSYETDDGIESCVDVFSAFPPTEAASGFSSTPLPERSPHCAPKAAPKYNSNVKSFMSPMKGVLALVMEENSAISFYGRAKILALSGVVSICGFQITAENQKFYPIYSSDKIFSFQIKAVSYHHKSEPHMKEIEGFLENIFCVNILNSILQCYTYTSVIVILKECDLTEPIDFVSLYCPEALGPAEDCGEDMKKMHRFRKFSLNFDDSRTFKEPKCYESVGDGVLKEIKERAARMRSGMSNSASRILVYGTKGSGKSTLLRYLVNRVLNEYPKVMYLDIDPGQTEFTPPGCFSLVEVTRPLLGPPFTHPRKPVVQAFYGSVNIEPCKHFRNCLYEIVGIYNRDYKDVPLFINTFGWLVGVGLENLNVVREMTRPTFIAQLEYLESDDDNLTAFSPNPIFNGDRSELIVPSACPKKITVSNPSYRRDLAVLAYLGLCQPFYEAPRYFNSFKPYKVKSCDVMIHITHHDVDLGSRMRAILGSFVALTVVSENDISHCAGGTCACPAKLANHTESNFGTLVGFAFIRNIDEANGVLYFVTPEPPEIVSEVNGFVKGNISIPEILYKKQGKKGMPYRNVRQMTAKKTKLSKPIGVQKRYAHQ